MDLFINEVVEEVIQFSNIYDNIILEVSQNNKVNKLNNADVYERITIE